MISQTESGPQRQSKTMCLPREARMVLQSCPASGWPVRGNFLLSLLTNARTFFAPCASSRHLFLKWMDILPRCLNYKFFRRREKLRRTEKQGTSAFLNLHLSVQFEFQVFQLRQLVHVACNKGLYRYAIR